MTRRSSYQPNTSSTGIVSVFAPVAIASVGILTVLVVGTALNKDGSKGEYDPVQIVAEDHGRPVATKDATPSVLADPTLLSAQDPAPKPSMPTAPVAIAPPAPLPALKPAELGRVFPSSRCVLIAYAGTTIVEDDFLVPFASLSAALGEYDAVIETNIFRAEGIASFRVCLGEPGERDCPTNDPDFPPKRTSYTVVATAEKVLYLAFMNRSGSAWGIRSEDGKVIRNELLRIHEQGHLSLAMIFAAKLTRVSQGVEAVGHGHTLRAARNNARRQLLRKLVDLRASNYRALDDADKKYDSETCHGTDPEGQARWTREIQILLRFR